MKVFISSTYEDLVHHRKAVTDVLQRMKVRFLAMEFFGSRTDEAIPVCKKEIASCDIFVGIYAWRYGWQQSPQNPSITEEEYRFAQDQHKPCLCYIIDELHPWPPTLIDRGKKAELLHRFKKHVGKLVRSTFTTSDNLAKQVAADLSREILPTPRTDSFGGIIRFNWDTFSSELQGVLATAYAQARIESEDGVVATRHVISALANTPNTARCIIAAFKTVEIQPLLQGVSAAPVYDLFNYDKPVSGCVLASMERLLPRHSPMQRLLAIELAVDLLKYGRGGSVANFREAGVGVHAVNRTVALIKKIAKDKRRLRDALATLTDAEAIHIAYLSEIQIIPGETAESLKDRILENATNQERLYILIGELMRRHPEFVSFSREK